MISRVLAAAVVCLGCGGDARSARSLTLERLPANAVTVVAAEGRALAHARFRPLVDVLRSELPAGFECVVDAALAGEHVAGAIGPAGEVTVALATKARVTCPALSRVEDGLWIATLGAGAPADVSVMTSDEHARARPFLKSAPIAVATTQRGVRLLATAQPHPLAAWVAFDASDVAAATLLEAEVKKTIEPYTRLEAIASVAKALTVKRQGSQVVVELGATQADLAVALRSTIQHAREPTAARMFPCPAPFAPPVLGCEQRECNSPLTCAVEHNKLDVYSLASALDELLAARKEAVVVNGRVEGVRLRDDLATLGLRTGDMLVAIDGKRVTSIDQVAPFLTSAKARTQLIVARAHRFGTIELVED